MLRNTRWKKCVNQAKRVILTEFLEAGGWDIHATAGLMELSTAQVMKLIRQHDVRKPEETPEIQNGAEIQNDNPPSDESSSGDDLDSESEETETTEKPPPLTVIDGGTDD